MLIEDEHIKESNYDGNAFQFAYNIDCEFCQTTPLQSTLWQGGSVATFHASDQGFKHLKFFYIKCVRMT